MYEPAAPAACDEGAAEVAAHGHGLEENEHEHGPRGALGRGAPVPFNAAAFLLDLSLVGLAVAWEVGLKLPFCGAMYGCGCTFAWGSVARGIAKCNYRNPAGPNCPWCSCKDGLGGWLYCWTFGPVFSVALMMFACAKVTGRPKIFGDLKRLYLRVRLSAAAAAAGVAWVSLSPLPHVSAKRAAVALALSLGLWTIWALLVGFSFWAATDYPTFLSLTKEFQGRAAAPAVLEPGSVFVDVGWLGQRQLSGSLTVLDARDHPGSTAGRVVAASQPAPWSAFTAGASSGLLLAPGELRLRLAARGVSPDRPVVVVGDWEAGWGGEGRVCWMLRYLGHAESYVLSGGVRDYEAAFGLVDGYSPVANASAALWPPLQAEVRATKASVAGSLGAALVIDSRTRREYEDAVEYGVARAGHIAGAVSWPWTGLFEGRSLRPCVALKEAWAALGNLSQPVVIYCTGGIRSGFLWAVMEHCGVALAANYDGSAWEWAADPAMPMVEGAAP